MIKIDYLLDENSFEDDLKQSPESENPAAVEETYFVMPIRMAVGETELLQLPKTNNNPWLSLPLLGFTTDIFRVVNGDTAPKDQEIYLAGGGQLNFSQEKGLLHIRSSINSKNVLVPIEQARNDFFEFAKRVRKLFLDRYSNIIKNPAWEQWFPRKNFPE
jgi:hypothetical protein